MLTFIMNKFSLDVKSCKFCRTLLITKTRMMLGDNLLSKYYVRQRKLHDFSIAVNLQLHQDQHRFESVFRQEKFIKMKLSVASIIIAAVILPSSDYH